MTAILFFLLALLFLLNTPIAVAIGASTAAAFLIKGDANMMLVAQRMYGGADSFPLMAVPLFMTAGVLMETGGISRRLVAFAESLVGWLPGGLAAVSIVSAMFFAGISGSAAADTAAVGAILIPAMVKNGYSRRYSGAVQAAAGSIGVIIPPSIPMIIFGVLTGASIGKLFAAGILPGLLMGVTLIIVALYIAKRQGFTNRTPFAWATVWRTGKGAFLALGAPLLILGGILGGIFTATESAAVAVIYAMVVGLGVYRELKLKALPQLFINAAITASVIMFIITQATVFSWFLTIEQIPQAIAGTVLGLTDNPLLLLLLVNCVLLVAGTFLETTAALILLVPVITPMLPSLGIDIVQLGAIVVTNLAIGMLTPPMGVCLIVSCGLSESSLTRISRSVLPFLAALLIDLLLITFWSPLTMWIPSMVN
ncbi:TRAP transporter large permease [Oceanidesulfovibrio marinus]|uniref:C4-dicarboxylate ABC transporter permease n=1 Tax=Oceanidesulfovibrio marinus TaxID=370038 RepID=A0A6P1ZCC6_9BACT|nr:TRAP transporter large permease [Oceanidesulfovibrio marinus]QJT10847.1 TRAP transporter large permease [Oceanidesulfovibrio marinus]TVM31847.1 C4-dicarboxylate ABC transporter permease [Oceanidesulfovibrio marinus]